MQKQVVRGDDQYCDVETTTIRVVDSQGTVIEEKTEEKVTCNDGAKDFLHGMGIADSCQNLYKLDLNGLPTRSTGHSLSQNEWRI